MIINRALAAFILLFSFTSAPLAALEVVAVEKAEVDAWLASDSTIPVVSIAFRIQGGAAADPSDLQGRARLLADLLTEGAGDMNGPSLKKRLADISASVSFSASQDAISGSLYTLSKNVKEAAKLLGLILTTPRLDTSDLERVRAAHLASLKTVLESPSHQAYRAFLGAGFQSHPYARSARGNISTLEKITKDDLLALMKERFGRDRLLVAAAGDISPIDLENVIDLAFGRLPLNSSGPAMDPQTVVWPRKPGRLAVRMKTPQSTIVFGGSGLRREDKDWRTATLLSEIMGGSFGSRLMDQVRVKRGLVYGINLSNTELESAALLLGSTSTQNSTVEETLAVIEEEWAKMSLDGPTQKELDDAKSYFIGSLPLALDSTTAIAQTLLSIRVNNLPKNYLDHRNTEIDAITLQDAKRVASKLFDPNNLTFSVAGSAEGLDQWKAIPKLDD
jgi:zinc protease